MLCIKYSPHLYKITGFPPKCLSSCSSLVWQSGKPNPKTECSSNEGRNRCHSSGAALAPASFAILPDIQSHSEPQFIRAGGK